MNLLPGELLLRVEALQRRFEQLGNDINESNGPAKAMRSACLLSSSIVQAIRILGARSTAAAGVDVTEPSEELSEAVRAVGRFAAMFEEHATAVVAECAAEGELNLEVRPSAMAGTSTADANEVSRPIAV